DEVDEMRLVAFRAAHLGGVLIGDGLSPDELPADGPEAFLEQRLILTSVVAIALFDGFLEDLVGLEVSVAAFGNAARRDRARQRPDRERPAAEAKEVNAVAGPIDARQGGVEVFHITAQPPARRAREQPQPLEALRSHPVVVDGYL